MNDAAACTKSYLQWFDNANQCIFIYPTIKHHDTAALWQKGRVWVVQLSHISQPNPPFLHHQQSRTSHARSKPNTDTKPKQTIVKWAGLYVWFCLCSIGKDGAERMTKSKHQICSVRLSVWMCLYTLVGYKAYYAGVSSLSITFLQHTQLGMCIYSMMLASHYAQPYLYYIVQCIPVEYCVLVLWLWAKCEASGKDGKLPRCLFVLVKWGKLFVWEICHHWFMRIELCGKR